MNNLDRGGEPIPDAELPEFYRRKAARLRCEADTAETIEMRIALLGAAERFELMAEAITR